MLDDRLVGRRGFTRHLRADARQQEVPAVEEDVEIPVGGGDHPGDAWNAAQRGRELLRDRARRLPQRARELKRHRNGQIAQRPGRRNFHGERGNVRDAEMRADGIGDAVVDFSLNGSDHGSGDTISVCGRGAARALRSLLAC